MSSPSSWRFVGGATPERLATLAQLRSPADLPEALRTELKLVCFHRDHGHTDPSFERAVFCGTVSPSLFDWFFNSRTGYRGAFYESPEAGSKFNRQLISHLASSLADWAARGGEDRAWVLNSLAAPSAKAWLAEHPGLCKSCAGEWTSSLATNLQIENGRWECSTHVHAAWGRQAPLLSKVRIFGGLINKCQQEWLAAHKADRAHHIWEHGWS
ncbi:hypothetical protein [Roseateles sp. P5_E11]